VSSEHDVEILVIGSGAAGLAAATAAHDAGCRRILVAEAEGVVGGSSRLSGGVVMASGSGHQRKAGIEDEPSRLFHEYMQLNQWNIEAAAVRRFAEETGRTVDWLVDQGVEFHDELIFGGDETVPRSHLVVGGGQGLIDGLHRQCRERDIDIALGQRVERLVVSAESVVGAAIGEDEITADAVIVATGGFGANPEKIQELFPSAWHEGEGWTWYIGAEGSRGDALGFGEQVGAQVLGYDRGLRTLNPNFWKVNEAVLPGWLVMVDANGHRFIDETAPYGIIDRAVRARGNQAFMVFDDAAIHPPAELADRYASSYKAEWPGHGPFRPRNWNADVVDAMVGQGRIHHADTLEDLATQMGIPARILVGSITRYNAGVAAGHDFDYLKPEKFLMPVSTGPFYAALVRPTIIAFTGTGLRIDSSGRVLHQYGHAIAGLYAAGECTGGIIGDCYMGSGNALANCTTFGRIAGQTAAAEIRVRG